MDTMNKKHPLPLHRELSHRSRYLNCDPCIIVASALVPLFMLGVSAVVSMVRVHGSEGMVGEL